MSKYLYQRVVQDFQGNIISGAAVTVRITGTSTTAQLYSDEAGLNPITQPAYTNANGQALFYVDAGLYDIEASKGLQVAPKLVGVDIGFSTEAGINANASADSANDAAAAANAAAAGFNYRGLWPDSGGSALKGETWQTQVGGVPTGQYFTALQDTTADPVGDDVNWRALNSVVSLYSVAEMKLRDFPAGVEIKTEFFNSEIRQTWITIKSEPSSGFYLTGINTWFAPKRKIKAKADLREFGLSIYKPGLSEVDCAPLIVSAFSDGVRELCIDDDVYISSYGHVINQSNLVLKGSGKIFVDWDALPAGSVGSRVDVFTFNGNGVEIKKINSENKSGKIDWVEDEYSALFNMNGDKQTIRHTDANYHRNYCYSESSDRLKFISNTGEGLLDGLSQQTGVHCHIHLVNTTRSIVRHNEGEGWTNGCLTGLSPQKCDISFNNYGNCGNHCIYGSSIDDSTFIHNKAYGMFTDFKVRGDYNRCIGTDVDGGTFTMTNRVADTGDGYALHSAIAKNTNVRCTRDNSIPFSISFRTGFDGKAKMVSALDTTIEVDATVPFCSTIIFDEIESINYSGEIRSTQMADRGLIARPTDGVTVSKVGFLNISSSSVDGVSGISHQLVAKKIVAGNIVARALGGTGASAGVVVIRAERASVSLFDIEAMSNIYCLNILEALSVNLNCGTLTRPNGATLPFINNNAVLLNKGTEVVEVTL